MPRLLNPLDQSQVSKQFPMPTDDASMSSSIQTVTGETVSLYYNSSGTRTLDAGQAAGVAVTGQLANKNVLDAGGGYIGTLNDTSLSFTGDCFTTEVAFPVNVAEANKTAVWNTKLSLITSGFANGEYCVDYRSGTIYGVKATTTASLTSTSYQINQAQVGTSGALASTVDITALGGETLGDHDTAVIDHGVQPLCEAKTFDGSAMPNAVAEGDAVRMASSESGIVYTTLVTTDGAESAMAGHDGPLGSGVGDAVLLIGLEAKDFDGSALPNAVGTEGDAVRPAGSLSGVQYVMAVNEDGSAVGSVNVSSASIIGPAEPTIDSYAHVAINLTTGADQVLVSSAPNKQIWVYGYALTCGDADGQTVSLQDEDDTAVTGIMEFNQYGGISVPPSGNFSMPVFKLATDKDLEIDITGGDVDGWLAYAIVSV